MALVGLTGEVAPDGDEVGVASCSGARGASAANDYDHRRRCISKRFMKARDKRARVSTIWISTHLKERVPQKYQRWYQRW